ncbi:MAG: hypothetical protein HDQ96_15950 [Lachnospiraceae bacterium]|nr:hypothetical protein [Lachnospiraceae bacterium]
MKTNIIETWEIFMKLCEEFPELYDKYVEKIELEMRNYTPDLKLTEEDKKRALENLQEKIKNDFFNS